MRIAEDFSAEALRRLMRDVVALSTLPAVWTEYRPTQIVRSLADVLAATLALDLVYIRLRGEGEVADGVIQVARSRDGRVADSQVQAIAETLAFCLDSDRSDPAATIRDPFGDAALRLAITRFGFSEDGGVVVAGSRQPRFPSEADRLLLGIAANQTAIVMRWRRVERLLGDQRERLRVTLASIGDAVITTDTLGTIMMLNPVAESLTGWRRDEAVGRPLEEVFRIIDEQTRKPLENPVARVLREQRVAGLGTRTCLIAKDGTQLAIDDSAAPIQETDGRVVGAVLVFRDSSQGRAGQIAQARLAALVDSSDDAIIGQTFEGVVTEWNAAAERLFGFSADETVGKSILSTIVPSDRKDELLAALQRVQQGERVDHFETVRRTKDGRLIPVSIRISPIRDTGGHILGASAIDRDITEQKRTEQALRELYEELRAADRRKDEFLAMLAHELRNPLAPIRSGLDLLAMEPGDHHETIELMQRQVEHLVRLVDDLLDVSRIMRGRIELRRDSVQLASIVTRSVETVRPSIESRNQTLHISLPNREVYLYADSVRLTQVLENLLTNSSKYTDPGGRIELAADLEQENVVLRVRDNGIGIEPELLPQVFDLFSQAVRTLDRSQGGLGIGLTLVHRLVHMHGGSVTAHSEGVGEGSEFVVRLPFEPAATRPAPAASRPSVASRGRRILVVDDMPGAARTLALLLARLGPHQVETAHDGESALQQLAAFQPDVVLLDIGLPRMDGYEVASKIRERAEHDRILLVALTGYGQAEDRHRSKAAGFDEHLVKPPSLDDIEQVLSHPKLAGPERRSSPAVQGTAENRETPSCEWRTDSAAHGQPLQEDAWHEALHQFANHAHSVGLAAQILHSTSGDADCEMVQRMLKESERAMQQLIESLRKTRFPAQERSASQNVPHRAR